MQTEQRDYGVVEEGGPVTASTGDEKTWSVLAHLSMLLNLVTGFLGPVAAFVVYLSTGTTRRRWRSRRYSRCGTRSPGS